MRQPDDTDDAPRQYESCEFCASCALNKFSSWTSDSVGLKWLRYCCGGDLCNRKIQKLAQIDDERCHLGHKCGHDEIRHALKELEELK